MSQPASQRMGTRPKNATQHPGRIVLEAEGHAKRCTKAQMMADRQRELEANQASEQATQKGHQHIATLQEQMAMDQAAARVDAPKPKRPRARPIAKAAKPSATSEQSMASGDDISTTALVVFATFLRSQPDLETDEDRQQFSACLLIKSAFLYGTIKEDGRFTTLGHAKRVLALTTLAAGRASKAPQKHNKSSGNESSALLAFSDVNWGDLVIRKMWERAQNLGTKRHGAQKVDEESEDERALIC
ncbi:uncharacterized protein EDB93DRAFT_1109516 [Suillus bovinus]|uniref:uncharacterized protein n=1 Tax=Suillus bovinus TaxID=48563 RepID=UPI001B866E3C|nr:uncharacterized protein EDB93DRAFT_1109516 [Suillus bovinus]KAG2126882.1 hypothetical protein EDB93DRAFT_1109516 [Suillus bovinus]